MTDKVWICQNWDHRWVIRDANFNEDKHLLKGWPHTGRCGWYELIPVEDGPEEAA